MKLRELRIAPTLTLSVGLLVLLAVGFVLLLQWTTSRSIMTDLAGRVVVRNLEIVSQGINGRLDPVREQVEYLAQRIEEGTYDLGARERLTDLLVGSVAAAPQIGGVVILNNDGDSVRIRREQDSGRYEVSFPDLNMEKALAEALREAEDRPTGYWGSLFYNPKIQTTFINYRRPLRRDGEFVGVIGAAVTIKEFSRLASKLSDLFGSTVFVMYGNDKVLAHPRLMTESFPRTTKDPAIPVAQFGDGVISGLGSATPSSIADLSADKDAQLHTLVADGVSYFVLRKPLRKFGDTPLTIGTYRARADVDAPVRLLTTSGVIGLGFLVISVIGAAWLSYTIAKPIRRVTEGVTKIGQFSFAEVGSVPTTWLKEVNDLANAFNGMLEGLRSFETYVPRKLVQRLITQEGGAEVNSEERELTVMFTDIAGFTSMCEGMTAKQVADFINEHLTLLAECVEDEGGTIDKYIGDALMAFWGAPEHLDNSPERACRAALKMAKRVVEDNKRRVAEGKVPVRVRVGIHTGPLVVGNIGAPSRINYTVVGDTVNTTQRLESLSKEVAPNAEISVLVSGSTQEALPEGFETKPAGSFQVKGKTEPVSVYQLIL